MTAREAEGQAELFEAATGSSDTVVVNERCLVRSQDGHRVVVVSGVVLAQYAVGDRMAESYAMVQLMEQGWATQREIGKAFQCADRTVRRYQRRFEAGGLAALGRTGGYPRGQLRLAAARVRLVERLKGNGESNREIARRVGVDEKAVRKLLQRLGWREVPSEPEQASLPLEAPAADPNLSASASPTETARPADTAPALLAEPSPGSTDPLGEGPAADPNLSGSADGDEEPVPLSVDTDPADRKLDRLLAYFGLLNDAAPRFRPGTRVPGAGVLLALPALLQTGVLDAARQVYGSIGPAFYGLRTTIVTFLLMALLRIKCPESMKEQPPEDLGRALGLDRAPEVKTLRRKLLRLASMGRATDFGRVLAQRRVATRGAALGFLYVDGHVRVYHGQRVLPKAHVARMRLSMPATTDYWVNDAAGEPLFVVTAEANATLVKMLPPLLEEVRGLVGERRTTIVFDRGGYSPKLFQRLINEGFDILTYRKGRFRRVPKSRFQLHEGVFDAEKVAYRLADQGVRLLGGKLRLRQVTRLSDNGHQTPILTSRRDLSALEVACRMFARWRQENFFKYLREEYALDALVDYSVAPDDPTRDVPNPARAALDAKVHQARAELARLQAHYGLEAFANPESQRPTMRGFKIAHGCLGGAVLAATKRLADLERKRAAVPRRVPVGNAVQGEVIKLGPERKHLTSLLKMVAYQAESDLVHLLAPHYKRVKEEGRTLIQSALASAADLESTDDELRVTLVPLSSAHRSRAIAALCEELNRTATLFPGTRLRLRYAVGGSR